MGRFVNVDPVYLNIGVANTKEEHQALQKLLSDPQALNSYSYSRNNPVLYIDPTGEFFSLPFIANSQWAQSTAMAMDQTAIGSWALDNPGIAGFAFGGVAGGAFAATSIGLGAAGVQGLGYAGTGLCMVSCQKIAETATSVGNKSPAHSLVGQSFGKLGTVVPNTGQNITGFTQHGLNQVVNRGVTPNLLQSTTQSPLVSLRQSGGNTLYLSENAGVVLNKTGEVVTAYGSNLFKPEVQNVVTKAVQSQ